MFDLDQVFPVAAAVPFGGRLVVAAPLSLAQLAGLQRWLRAVVPHPIEAARAELAELSGPALGRRAGELFRAGEHWPVRLFTAGADLLLGTDAGRLVLLSVALADRNPGAPLAELAAVATVAEWEELGRVLFGVDPTAELIRLADPEEDAAESPTNWGRIVADLAADGFAPSEVAGWTLAQLAAVRHRGERVGLLPRPRDGESLEDAARRRALALGLDDEEPAASDADDGIWRAEAAANIAMLAAIAAGGG